MEPDTATLETGPAYDPNNTDSTTDHIVGLLGTGSAANPTDETEAATEQSQPAPDGETSPEKAEGSDPAQQQETQTQDEPKHKVKVRGEEREVPLSELLNGYSRTEDYKAKTAELAEARKAIEAERTNRLTQIDQVLQTVAAYDPVIVEGNKTDWAKLAQEDPTAYVQKKALYEARVIQMRHLHDQREQLASQAQREAIQRSHEALLADDSVPEWRDEAKRTKLTKDLQPALKEYGFSDAEISGLADHRALKIAIDALRWRQAEANRKSAEAKIRQPVPKTMKPGSSETAARSPDARSAALMSKALRTGKTDDAVNAILAKL